MRFIIELHSFSSIFYRVLSADVQGAFATALCLLNISVGSVGKRAALGLNWVRVKSPGNLHRREAHKFFFSFLFLGKSILGVIAEKDVEFISHTDVESAIRKLYEDMDLGARNVFFFFKI